MAINCSILSVSPRTCAINIAATASYRAVPSILIVAPIGITNLDTLGSTLFFSSKQLIEIGSVALLLKKLNLTFRFVIVFNFCIFLFTSYNYATKVLCILRIRHDDEHVNNSKQKMGKERKNSYQKKKGSPEERHT
jgi:hypothetical protein